MLPPFSSTTFADALGLPDYSQVDMLGSRYTFVSFRARRDHFLALPQLTWAPHWIRLDQDTVQTLHYKDHLNVLNATLEMTRGQIVESSSFVKVNRFVPLQYFSTSLYQKSFITAGRIPTGFVGNVILNCQIHPGVHSRPEEPR